MQYFNNVFCFLSLNFYYIQQQIYTFFYLRIDNFNPLLLCVVFFTGALTALNPCFLSILPLSVSYSLNQQIDKRFNNNFFILGIVTIYIALTFLIHLLQIQYTYFLSLLPLVSSVLLIFLGLNFLNIFNYSQLLPISLLQSFSSFLPRNLLLNNYLAGCLLGCNALPCSTPLTIVIILLLSHSSNLIFKLLYFFSYTTGLIVSIFFIINTVINYLMKYSIYRVWNFIVPLTGFFVLTSGFVAFLENCYN
uniref:Thiol:disulfide interchange protein n=1 Tax=Spyridia filamentosa TaxID=196632 RepID=A0A1Z1MJX5_SPYFI|nr:thiol:disulfide interchange protein [Spyridia filamentosa]ARW66125.1 thiol:disulfide interchange protein [Spyridia filamentosa]